jgi:hypothetical protein
MTAAVRSTVASATVIENGTVPTCLTDAPRRLIEGSGHAVVRSFAPAHTVERST